MTYPMIERHWKGVAKKESAQDYRAHLQHETFKQLERINGFVSASILTRHVNEGIEFLIITKWQHMEAIKQFAGSDTTKAVVPKVVQDMMIHYDNTVSQYEIEYRTATDQPFGLEQ